MAQLLLLADASCWLGFKLVCRMYCFSWGSLFFWLILLMLSQLLVVVAVLVVMAAVVAMAVGLSLVVVCSELLMHCLPCYVVILLLLLLRLSGRHGYTAKRLGPTPADFRPEWKSRAHAGSLQSAGRHWQQGSFRLFSTSCVLSHNFQRAPCAKTSDAATVKYSLKVGRQGFGVRSCLHPTG